MGDWYKNEDILAARSELEASIGQLERDADSNMLLVMSDCATVYYACCELLNATCNTKTSKYETYKRVMRGLKCIGTVGFAKAVAVGCRDLDTVYSLFSLKHSGIVCQGPAKPHINAMLHGHMEEARRTISKYFDIDRDYADFDTDADI